MNQPLYVLDTDTATHLERGRQSVTHRVATLSQGQVCITVLTQIEMREGRYHGLRTVANKEQLIRAWQLLQNVEGYDLLFPSDLFAFGLREPSPEIER
jgi:predicted nucleic acid-binding protein